MITLIDAGSCSAGSIAASSSAIWVAARAMWVQWSVCTMRRFSIQSSAAKPSTSPASWLSYFEGSKRSMRRMALVPAPAAFHHASVPIPLGATTPMPVTQSGGSRWGSR